MPTELFEVSHVAIAAVALVSLLGIVRLYSGSVLLQLRYLNFWGNARRLFMPVIDKVAKRLVGVSAENRAFETEHVVDVQADPKSVAEGIDKVSEREFEVSVLSGYKTDWDGNKEIASIVGYDGSKPWPNAPDWLRADQVHITMFVTDDLETRVTAHYEANSWRPDRWKDHLFKGKTFDAERGVDLTREWMKEAGLLKSAI